MTRERDRAGWQRNEMIVIYNSLDWNLYDHLRQADSIVRTMLSEMSTAGIPVSMAVPFLQEKVAEMGERIKTEAEEEIISRARKSKVELSENELQISKLQNPG